MGGVKKAGYDFYQAGKDSAAARLFGRKVGDKPLGRQLGEKVFGKPLTGGQREEAARATRAAAYLSTPAGRAAFAQPLSDVERRRKDIDLSSAQLSKKHVGETLAKQQPGEVAHFGTVADRSRLRAVVGNDELVNNLPDEHRVNLQANIHARVDLADDDKRRILEELDRTIARVEQKKGKSS